MSLLSSFFPTFSTYHTTKAPSQTSSFLFTPTSFPTISPPHTILACVVHVAKRRKISPFITISDSPVTFHFPHLYLAREQLYFMLFLAGQSKSRCRINSLDIVGCASIPLPKPHTTLIQTTTQFSCFDRKAVSFEDLLSGSPLKSTTPGGSLTYELRATTVGSSPVLHLFNHVAYVCENTVHDNADSLLVSIDRLNSKKVSGMQLVVECDEQLKDTATGFVASRLVFGQCSSNATTEFWVSGAFTRLSFALEDKSDTRKPAYRLCLDASACRCGHKQTLSLSHGAETVVLQARFHSLASRFYSSPINPNTLPFDIPAELSRLTTLPRALVCVHFDSLAVHIIETTLNTNRSDGLLLLLRCVAHVSPTNPQTLRRFLRDATELLFRKPSWNPVLFLSLLIDIIKLTASHFTLTLPIDLAAFLAFVFGLLQRAIIFLTTREGLTTFSDVLRAVLLKLFDVFPTLVNTLPVSTPLAKALAQYGRLVAASLPILTPQDIRSFFSALTTAYTGHAVREIVRGTLNASVLQALSKDTHTRLVTVMSQETLTLLVTLLSDSEQLEYIVHALLLSMLEAPTTLSTRYNADDVLAFLTNVALKFDQDRRWPARTPFACQLSFFVALFTLVENIDASVMTQWAVTLTQTQLDAVGELCRVVLQRFFKAGRSLATAERLSMFTTVNTLKTMRSQLTKLPASNKSTPASPDKTSDSRTRQVSPLRLHIRKRSSQQLTHVPSDDQPDGDSASSSSSGMEYGIVVDLRRYATQETTVGVCSGNAGPPLQLSSGDENLFCALASRIWVLVDVLFTPQHVERCLDTLGDLISTHLFHVPMTSTYLPVHFSFLRRVISRNASDVLHSKTILYPLLRCTLKLCNDDGACVRDAAVSFLSFLLSLDFSDSHHIDRSTQHIVTAIAELNFKNSEHCCSSFHRLVPQSSSLSPVLIDQIKTLVSFVLELLEVSSQLVRLDKYKTDQNLIQDKCFKVSKQLVQYPQLYFVWIDKLVQTQLSVDHHIEAGFASLFHVVCIHSVLKHSLKLNVDIQGIAQLAQTPEFTHTKHLTEHPFTELGMRDALRRAFDCFREGRMYDLAVHVGTFELGFAAALGDHAAIADTHERLAAVHRLFLDKGMRYVGEYYAVGFHGAPFKELNGRTFIYRSQLRIGDAVTELKERLGISMDCSISHVDFAKNIDNADPRDALIQIGGVTRVVPHGERKSDVFVMDIPFVKDGQAKNASVASVWKRRMTFVTKYKMPTLLVRVAVKSVDVVELDPIQCCVDDVEKKTRELNDLIEQHEAGKGISLSTLQPLLQGSLIPQVNTGLGVYCLLTKDEVFEEEERRQLSQAIRTFLELARRGLNIHHTICERKHLALHTKMNDGLEKLFCLC